MGLVTETNEEYYAGEKVFLVQAGSTISTLATTFNTELVLATANNNANFIVQYSEDNGVTWVDYTDPYTLSSTVTYNDTVNLSVAYPNPVLCITLIRTHIITRAMINPNNPGNKKSKRNMTSVINKEVRKTLPKFLFFALLNKPNAIFRKIVITMSNSRYKTKSISRASSCPIFQFTIILLKLYDS